MTGILLRLAAPLQSWGERGVYTDRDTIDFPTRSGLLGMLAAAQGVSRGRSIGRLTELDFVIRLDRPGTHHIDFHTTGGGYPRSLGIPTADGKRKNSTIITRRHYLCDAVFTVACTGPDTVITDLAADLRQPHWQPFLGRRSCPPEQPLYLGVVDDAVAELDRVPLPRPRPDGRTSVMVDFIHTAEPGDDDAWTQVLDEATSFPIGDRSYGLRSIRRTSRELPAALCHPDPHVFQTELARYLGVRL